MYYIIPCPVHVHSSFYNLRGERMENMLRGVSSSHHSFSHISNFWGSSFWDFHRHYVWHPSVSNLLRWNRYWESQEWWLSPKEGLLAKPEGHLWPPLQLEVVLAIQYTKVCIFQIISALCVTTEDLREWLIVLTNMSYYTLDDVLLLFYFYMILILWYCYKLFLLP